MRVRGCDSRQFRTRCWRRGAAGTKLESCTPKKALENKHCNKEVERPPTETTDSVASEATIWPRLGTIRTSPLVKFALRNILLDVEVGVLRPSSQSGN
ncbi:hypothetical protein J6590_001953 [Homalodisca vitripennis]|nr:hypothetical protein J6590_001953 [Homalodisca vitripennis]